ncbi:PREDICTED: uncharacterized protein LOC105561050 [Vollenhovia emeryi]|uniref:uncharacterized protein LOC105561050 n=1 Tax=Vollenhovia emeryi TaxID=411798 RepID=UPI0005F55C8B|nr:PREDICTED: uncharacterized protein LOC105561050 [Vollenhovia emeryi]
MSLDTQQDRRFSGLKGDWSRKRVSGRRRRYTTPLVVLQSHKAHATEPPRVRTTDVTHRTLGRWPTDIPRSTADFSSGVNPWRNEESRWHRRRRRQNVDMTLER